MSRFTVVLLACSILGAACAPGTESTSTSTTASVTTASTTTSTSAVSSTVTSNPAGDDVADSVDPSYDVFLAAVAEVVAETRFADAPYDHAEIVVSTGLALCEAIAAGDDPDGVVFEYLSDLTGGDPAAADDDQLQLAGALIGAAETALCADGA